VTGSSSATAIEAKPAAATPKIRCAPAKIHSLKPSAAGSSIEYHTPHCITGHTTAVNKSPPTIISVRVLRSRWASAAIAMPKMLATVMCTARPMSSAGALNLASSGADR
jgi:hypothetical protein